MGGVISSLPALIGDTTGVLLSDVGFYFNTVKKNLKKVKCML